MNICQQQYNLYVFPIYLLAPYHDELYCDDWHWCQVVPQLKYLCCHNLTDKDIKHFYLVIRKRISHYQWSEFFNMPLRDCR